MATTQQNTPRGILSGLFGPKFLDDPEAIAGIAQSLGVGSGGASPQPGTSPSPDGPNSPAGQNPAQAGPVSGVVPKSFTEWHADPVNVAKIPVPVNDAPLPTTGQGWHPPMLPPEQLPQQQPAIQPASAPAAAAAPAPDSSAVPPSGAFPSRADWLKANPVQVQGAPKPLAGTKKSFLGMALATLGDNIGAALSGGRPMVGSEWMKNVQDIRDYDRNLPVLKQQAENQAYSTALQQEQEKAGITHLQAQTAMLQQSPTPFTKAVGDTRADIENLWKSGSLSEQDFDKQIQLKMGALPPGVARNITPEYLSSVKQLPQQKPIFKIQSGTIEPLQYRGSVYGAAPQPNEPPEISAARQEATASQQSAEFAKVDPIIVAKIGPYPVNGSSADKSAWADKARKMKIDLAAAPKIIVQNAQNPFQAGGIPPGVTGESALAVLPPTEAATIKFYGDGHGDIQTFMSRMTGKAKSDFISKVLAYNPQFNQGTFGIEKKVGEKYTSGNVSDQLLAINTAREHMKTFGQIADALNNNNVQVANKLGNIFKIQFGSDKATNFKIAAQAFGGEVGKALDGAHVTAEERKQAADSFNPNMSPEQFSGAIKTVDELLSGKQTAAKNAYDQGRKGQPNFGNQSTPSTKHIIQVGNDRYQYKGTGATDDLSNYDKLPK